MKFSVLLLLPDYIAENFGQETFFDHFEADTAQQAVLVAQAFACDTYDQHAQDSIDFFPLLVIHGWHDDVRP